MEEIDRNSVQWNRVTVQIEDSEANGHQVDRLMGWRG
jgi:hypothetical protein